MPHRPLQQVIETEDEIREKVRGERRRAAEWLDTVKHRCKEEKEAQRKQLEETFQQKIEAARAEKRAAAEHLLADADRRARTLNGMDDNALQDIMRRRLGLILPGRAKEGLDGETWE